MNAIFLCHHHFFLIKYIKQKQVLLINMNETIEKTKYHDKRREIIIMMMMIDSTLNKK